MKPDYIKNNTSRDELIAALETQIEKQDKIISIQEETIKVLTEQNDELMKTINKLFTNR